MDHKYHINNCSLCHSGIINTSGKVVSTVTGNKYRVEETLSCANGGIYVVPGKCLRQYSGKTIHFGVRANEHFCRNASSIHKHKQECSSCNDARDFSICFVENYLNRGKYSLSEREFLWNYRIKGVLIIHIVLPIHWLGNA